MRVLLELGAAIDPRPFLENSTFLGKYINVAVAPIHDRMFMATGMTWCEFGASECRRSLQVEYLAEPLLVPTRQHTNLAPGCGYKSCQSLELLLRALRRGSSAV